MKYWLFIFAGIGGSGIILLLSLLAICGLELEVHFLNVGQGDSVLITTPYHENVLIDGGPDGTILTELGQILPFFDYTIDVVILSHPHADHVNGLVEVLKKYQVKQVLMTGAMYRDPGYDEFLRLINEKKIPVIFVDAGFDLQLHDMVLDILYPFTSIQGKEFENINNSSITMRVLYGKTSFYFSGDLEDTVESKIIETKNVLSADIFKAAHHGSRTANSLSLLQRTGAGIAVIQCGIDNQFKHPHIEALNNFATEKMRILRTDINGRIKFVSDGEKVTVQ